MCFISRRYSSADRLALILINGESYIVVNYKANSLVKSIWVLWNAEDRFFSPRLKNSNARSLNREAARDHIEVVFEATKPT